LRKTKKEKKNENKTYRQLNQPFQLAVAASQPAANHTGTAATVANQYKRRIESDYLFS
jgi:hypothetical protein